MVHSLISVKCLVILEVAGVYTPPRISLFMAPCRGFLYVMVLFLDDKVTKMVRHKSVQSVLKSLSIHALARISYANVPSLSGNLDFCPVCKSSRYLNPELRFLVNPECYHKMCTSCVDRIFSSGPAPCPVAGCARTLRKQRFRKQTFDDIQIEREVDIRRRLSQMSA